jgi:hypothetical protein
VVSAVFVFVTQLTAALDTALCHAPSMVLSLQTRDRNRKQTAYNRQKPTDNRQKPTDDRQQTAASLRGFPVPRRPVVHHGDLPTPQLRRC